MQLPKIVRNVLRSSAPTLLAALSLPPPLNGIAARVAAGALQSLDGEAAPPATAEDAVRLIERSAGDPEVFARLREAEGALQRYEREAGIRFAELAVRDRERASDLQARGGIADAAYRHGMRIVWIAMACMFVIILAALAVAMVGVPARDTQYMVAAFGLVGTAVGFINGIAGSVVTFYYGSSQGSKDKTEAMAGAIRRYGDEMERAAERSRADLARAAAVSGPSEARLDQPAEKDGAPRAFPPRDAPARLDLVAEMLPSLVRPHRHFEESAEWRLTSGGISIDGAPPERTPGRPATVERIWDRYGDDCADAAIRFGVPVELIVATVATESGGDPDARRPEPRLGTESVGLMQTLVTTAREALGKRALSGDDLLDPATSIAAGTAFLAQQRKSTHFDPPLVAAAYNAGSLRRDPSPRNRWSLVCYPAGTGAHIDRFAAWFGDAMAVSAEADWCRQGRVPSFAGAFLHGDGGDDGDGGTENEASEGRQGSTPPEPDRAAASPAGPDRAMALAGLDRPVALDEIGGHGELVRQVQAQLAGFGYLDPPPDGAFGPISTWALEAFCDRNALPLAEGVTPAIARALADPGNALPAPGPCGEHPWLDRVIAHMDAEGHWIARAPECRNIVYLEGANPDGTANADRADIFNDLRVVFWTDVGGQMQVRAWAATTEPGRHFTDRPVNPLGAARIRFGQYKAWRVGTHRAGSDSAHEALVQVSDVAVHRDLNRDHSRAGDRVFTGLFGINQHWGYDRPEDSIGRSSAGCLVGRTRAGHRAFMTEVKADPRYRANPHYRFVTTILPADRVLG